MLSQLTIALMRLSGHLPLPWLRAMGVVLGWVLYATVASRRRVVLTNLGLCFGQLTLPQRKKLSR